MATRIFFLLWLAFAGHLVAQQAPPQVAALIRQAVPAPAPPADHARWFRDSPTDIQRVLAGLFWGYKQFISSQDRPGCQFWPSCSEYAIGSIRKHGLLVGAMATFDRLSRCNGLSREQYPVHSDNKRSVDRP